jgi:hypothetical protein
MGEEGGERKGVQERESCSLGSCGRGASHAHVGRAGEGLRHRLG